MRKFLLLVLFMAPVMLALAQKKITGKVLDGSNSLPLQGATVAAKGSSNATQTDANGVFSITVTDAVKKLVITYVGFEAKEVAINDNTDGLEIRLDKSGELVEITVLGSRNLTRTKVETPAAIDIIPIAQVTNQVGNISEQLV